jgi:hypothetical protein
MRLAPLHIGRAAAIRFARLTLLVSTPAVATSCSGIEPAPAPVSSPLTIESLIGDAACDVDAQCRTIAVGAKACGGPQAYLAWSSKRTDGAKLKRVVDEQARAAKAEAEARGIMSDCSLVADPGAYCAGPPAAAAAPNARESPSRSCRLRSGGGAGRIF